MTSIAQATVNASLREVSYQFNADGVMKMTEEVRDKGPKSNRGLDTWAILYTDITAKYDFRTTEHGCQFGEVEVDVLAEVVLPQWGDIQAQGEKIQQWWLGYTTYLKEHELMHYSVAKKHAEELLKKMKLPHHNQSCQDLKVTYFSYKHEMLAAMKRADKNIDFKSTINLHNNRELMGPLKEFISNNFSFVSNKSLGF